MIAGETVANREERAEKSGAFVTESPPTVTRPVNQHDILPQHSVRLTVVLAVCMILVDNASTRYTRHRASVDCTDLTEVR
jgi:hypothetical protein